MQRKRKLLVLSKRQVLAIVFAVAAVGRPAEGYAQRSAAPATGKPYDQLRVGNDDPNYVVLPTNQVLTPAGRQITLGGRPTDLAISCDGRWLAVLSAGEVVAVNLESNLIAGRVAHPGGSCKGIVFTADGKKLLASSVRGTIGVYHVAADGKLSSGSTISLPTPRNSGRTNALPIGLALEADGRSLWVALNLNNTLAEIDLASSKVVREISVGNAPYDVVLVGRKAYVSNWAGRHPDSSSTVGPSGIGAPLRVDPRRHIASDGSVSVVDLTAGRQIKEVVVGLHPSGLAVSPDGRYVCVTNANSDTVSVIDTRSDEVVQSVSVRSDKSPGLFGSAPNALVFSGDGRQLYVSNGTNNAIAVLTFNPPHCRWQGFLPTAWYPAGIVLDRERHSLCVANVKGVGSRDTNRQGRRKVKGKTVFGYSAGDHQGTICVIRLPKPGELAAYTQQVLKNNRTDHVHAALAKPNPQARPLPVPKRTGEPSLFKHVLYIIKENRTYDQVLGDIAHAEGDADLCIYGREVTPNHHKIVEEFVLLDNFYCSGVISADGHQWTDEAYVTDYVEKFFGGFVRSYPYDGGDALAYASSGFLWDAVIARGKTMRIYGEFVEATIRWKDASRAGKPTFLDCLRDFETRSGKIDVRATAKIKSIAPYICPTAIGFPGTVPDVFRAEQFLKELRDFERRGVLPEFMMMLLPNDHTSGTASGYPTPAASVADNDLALGRVVEALSRSRFWKDTCIFVVEDDPQNGFDHIDGHRTVAMVISPYSRLRKVDSTNYNQTSMVRTIELILGLPPMNQLDASATPMHSCFGEVRDLTPYQSVPNNVPLDQLNLKLSQISDPRQRHWAAVSLALPLEDVDEADEDTLNRILWHAARGRDDTYPAWAVNTGTDE